MPTFGKLDEYNETEDWCHYIERVNHFFEAIACIARVSVRFRSKERESKTARKMPQVKERRGSGEERKETLADKTRDFENRPLSLSCLSARTDISRCQQLS